MSQVATQSVRMISEGIAKLKAVPMESLHEGSPLGLFEVRTQKYVPWESFVTWVDWLDAQKFGPLNWFEVGATAFEGPTSKFAVTMLRMALSTRTAYRIAGHWFGHLSFPVIKGTVEYVGESDVRETLVLFEGLRPAPQIFEMFHGTLTYFPKQIFGMKPVPVTYSGSGQTFVYEIKLPPKFSWRIRLMSRLRGIFSLRHLLNELENQQGQLHANSQNIYRERDELRHFIEKFPDGVLIHGDGPVVYINERMCQYLGVKAKDVVGKPVLDLLHPDFRADVTSRIKKIEANERGAVEPRETKFLIKNSNETFLGESVGINMMFEGVPAIGVVTRSLAERTRLHAQLAQADRLKSLGQLAAGVGHEINNPLSYIMLKMEGLDELTEASNDPEVTALIEEVQSGLERIQVITRDLKTLARGRPAEETNDVDVNAVLKQAIQMAKNQIEHRAQLRVQFGRIPFVHANEARLSQVFLNLLINASHAVDPGRASQNLIEISTSIDSQSRVMIEVRDSGSGISDGMKKKIFQPFQTSKPVGTGTGLGLSISKSIIESYSGEIEFESEEGVGTVFRVILPKAPDVTSSVERERSKPAGEAPHVAPMTGHVLIIDDEEALLAAVSRAVSKRFEVTTFEDARGALRILQEGAKFDCIICDLMMPNIDGLEFYEKLAEVSPAHLDRVFFLTGGSFGVRTDEFLSRPEIEWREKPISGKELIRAIEETIQKSRAP